MKKDCRLLYFNYLTLPNCMVTFSSTMQHEIQNVECIDIYKFKLQMLLCMFNCCLNTYSYSVNILRDNFNRDVVLQKRDVKHNKRIRLHSQLSIFKYPMFAMY